jgi:hypothetical protein
MEKESRYRQLRRRFLAGASLQYPEALQNRIPVQYPNRFESFSPHLSPSKCVCHCIEVERKTTNEQKKKLKEEELTVQTGRSE